MQAPSSGPELARPAYRHPARTVFIGPDGLRAGWSLLAYLSMLLGIVYAFTLIAQRVQQAVAGGAAKAAAQHETTLHFIYFNEGLLVLSVAAATWLMSRIERRPVATYGTGSPHKLPHFLAGLAWGAAFLSALVFSLKAAGLLAFDGRLLSGASIPRYGLLWLGGFLLVGIFEEYLMRGYLQFTLARGLTGIYRALRTRHAEALGFWSSAGVLSLIFGLGHRSNPGESPLGLVAAAAVALVFCLSLWRTGSLWWAIGFHAAWDWAQSFVYGVADSGFLVQHRLMATHAVGRPMLSGGATGPEGSLFVFPTIALVAVAIQLTLPRERGAGALQASLD